MTQGQGADTARKEEGFRALIRSALKLAGAPTIATFPFWCIDLTCGSGFNDKAGCHGSPVIFLEEILRADRRFMAYFCDNEPSHTDALRLRLPPQLLLRRDSAWQVVCADNRILLPHIAEVIAAREDAQHAVGLCLCDPNGWKAVPVEALQAFARRFPKVDLVLNLNLSLFRKVRGHRRKCKPGFDDWPSVAELPALFSRNHWLIRNPSRCGKGHKFAILFGRNHPRGMKKFEDFVPIDSKDGQDIIESLHRVPMGQQDLFEKEQP
jgi:hypothetical protein